MLIDRDEFNAERLLAELRALDEHSRIEAKKASKIGDSIMQTVCAFANEPGLGGGYLLLGICEPDEKQSTFWVEGIKDADTILNDLQTKCREQFETPIAIKSETSMIDGKQVIVVFIPECEPSAKPCTFQGKFDKKNKRKTGVWRRGLNSDYECSQAELEPILLAKAGLSYEQIYLEGARWDDLDPEVIALYRELRMRIKPQAKELIASDEEMLRALNIVKRENSVYVPNIAGLLLFGKPLSLRRLLPATRVDYVRIQGTQWVENPEQRFATTMDFREPLIRLISRLEATILDDLPRHFRLNEGDLQRSDQPLVPQKVIREAVVNALMHRDYRINQPTLIVRYSNRIEIRNAGYSLKPEALLGELGSVLRNPIIANVLYDLDLAETKGSGIRTMRGLLEVAGLTAPVFFSDIINNYFSGVYLLHQLIGEEQLAWLGQFKDQSLTDDEAKALILAWETGAVDNAALRAVTGLDTLTASQVLGRLHHNKCLLNKGGAGPSTYYQLAKIDKPESIDSANRSDLDANRSDLDANRSDLDANRSDLETNTNDLPSELQRLIIELSPKARKDKLWPVILWLCAICPQRAETLAMLIKRQVTPLKTNHLSKLREKEHLLEYLYPEVINHPEQAYKTTKKGLDWLREQGIIL